MREAAGDHHSLARRAEPVGEEHAPLAVEAGEVIFGDPEARFTDLVELLLNCVARMRLPGGLSDGMLDGPASGGEQWRTSG